MTATVAVGHWIARMQTRSEQTCGVLTASERGLFYHQTSSTEAFIGTPIPWPSRFLSKDSRSPVVAHRNALHNRPNVSAKACLPGDSTQLNFSGSFRDRVKPRVAKEALDRTFHNVALASENLHGIICQVYCGLARYDFCH